MKAAEAADSKIGRARRRRRPVSGFAKKIAAKKMGGDDAAKPRTTFMTMTGEVLKVVTDVPTRGRGGPCRLQGKQMTMGRLGDGVSCGACGGGR